MKLSGVLAPVPTPFDADDRVDAARLTAALGPLAGRIWRVGLMGASSSPRLIVLLLGALDHALALQRQRTSA